VCVCVCVCVKSGGNYCDGKHAHRRFQRPRGLSRRSAAARLQRLWTRIPPGTWMSACCECFVLSGRDLCDELITRLEESYRLWCVIVCVLENPVNEEALAHWGGCRAKNQQQTIMPILCQRYILLQGPFLLPVRSVCKE